MRLLRLAMLLAVLSPAALSAQSDRDGQAAVPADSTRPPGAFTMVELRRFATTFALGGVAYLADQSLRDAVQRPSVQDNSLLQGLADFGNPYGAPGVLALGAAMWGGGLIAKRPVLAASGFRALETIAVSGTVTQMLKQTFGRARPFTSPDNPADWKLFRGDDPATGSFASMPSGHTTAAFAFASAVTSEVKLHAPEHARVVGIVTYGAAAVTGYARMHEDRHWFSDVVVGAGIGTVTGWAITRWHATRPNNAIDRVFLRPIVAQALDGSTRLGLQIQTR